MKDPAISILSSGVAGPEADGAASLLETTRLLPPPTPDQPQSLSKKHSSNYRIYIILYSILAAVNLGSQIYIPSLARLLESIYCYKWYAEHNPEFIIPGQSIDESFCKLDLIQQQVSTLRGWMELWNGIPAIFLAIPFGILADQLGRRWIFRLSISAIFLRYLWVVVVCATGIPMGAVYFASALNIFCGGDVVAEMLFCVILIDVTSANELYVEKQAFTGF